MNRCTIWTKLIQARQIIATAFWYNIFSLSSVYMSVILMVLLLRSNYYWIGVAYCIYIYFDDTPTRGTRMISFIKNSKILKDVSDYFPLKLIKTADLDASKNYLFAAHPHGAFGCSYCISFSTETQDFKKLFPGCTSRLMIHYLFYYVPFYRELVMAFSLCPCTDRSLKYLLDAKRFKGNCTVVLVGGSREAIESKPGKQRLILNRRKGFIRVAIQTGASLVPVYGFGETEVFRTTKFTEGTLMHKLQYWILETTNFSLLRLSGIGFFQNSFGWIPFKKPLYVVVGAPIHVKKNENPTKEEIDALHSEYKEKLISLFESEKSKYLKNSENVHLEFVG